MSGRPPVTDMQTFSMPMGAAPASSLNKPNLSRPPSSAVASEQSRTSTSLAANFGTGNVDPPPVSPRASNGAVATKLMSNSVPPPLSPKLSSSSGRLPAPNPQISVKQTLSRQGSAKKDATVNSLDLFNPLHTDQITSKSPLSPKVHLSGTAKAALLAKGDASRRSMVENSDVPTSGDANAPVRDQAPSVWSGRDRAPSTGSIGRPRQNSVRRTGPRPGGIIGDVSRLEPSPAASTTVSITSTFVQTRGSRSVDDIVSGNSEWATAKEGRCMNPIMRGQRPLSVVMPQVTVFTAAGPNLIEGGAVQVNSIPVVKRQSVARVNSKSSSGPASPSTSRPISVSVPVDGDAASAPKAIHGDLSASEPQLEKTPNETSPTNALLAPFLKIQSAPQLDRVPSKIELLKLKFSQV